MDKPIRSSTDSGESSHKSDKSETISFFWIPVFVLPWLVLYLLTILAYHALPAPILIADEASHPDRFIGERAKRLNDELTGIGPRVVGSVENEVHTIDFFQREVEKVMQSRNPIHNIEYEVQKTSGSFQVDAMTSVYQDIRNFVVRITPADRTPRHSLLLNSHFDSVPHSRGAGDSATMCVVMLEILRVMSQSSTTFEHSIIFLFNGAEEVGLQGSHMFVTQHRWAADVGAVMNMDACGTGGRDLMFQSTANNQWLLKYYKKHVIYPTATVLIDDLFQLRIIPSDSDFRIFRDYGQIPGMDFAVYRNGYVYHTQFDTSDKIPLSTYQNAGDNLLSIAKAIANAEELSDKNAYKVENLVFFDYLGWFMVSYTVTEAIIINVIICLVCAGAIILSIWTYIKNADVPGPTVWIQFGLIIIIQLVSIVVAGGAVVILSLIYDACNRSLSYFSNPWILFGIYYCPLMFFLGLGCAIHVTFWRKREIHLRFYVQMYLHAQYLFNCILLLGLTITGFRSAFIVLISVIFYSGTTIINTLTKLHLRDTYWTLIHFLGQVFPYMFYAYYTMFTLELFVPIQGRAGPFTNPDSVTAIVSIMFGLLMTGFLMPTFSLFKRPIFVVGGFLVLFICFGIVLATPVGFPFKKIDSPQRFWMFNTQRTFHNLDGSIRKSDNGYFLLTMDRHMNDYVKDIVPEINLALPTANECDTEQFCGMPLYSTRMIAQSKKSFWIPQPVQNQILPVNTKLDLVDREVVGQNVERLHFELSGPDHMALFISPKLGNKIVLWDISNAVPEQVAPKWGNRLSYFVFVSHGGIDESFKFSMDIEVNDNSSEILDIAAIGHYVHYDELQTAEFRQFIESFPDWTQITPWMCTYESWVY